MKALYIIFILAFTSLNTYSQEQSFGHITITPYISDQSGLNETAAKFLKTKLIQMVTIGDATGGFDRRFIITPALNVLSKSTTASIPQKTSLKVSFTFFIGDGVAGSLFGSGDIEVTGIGDSYEEAIHSAIRKINVNNRNIQALIADSKKRIVTYYNITSKVLIKEAEGYIANADYESALSRLAIIPSLCKEYDTARELIIKCGGRILERDNTELLMKAKTAWSTSPDHDGAKQAYEYISLINVSSSSVKAEVDHLNNQIRQRLAHINDMEMELQQAKIMSDENLRKEQIKASEKVTSSFFGILPDLVYSIFRWF